MTLHADSASRYPGEEPLPLYGLARFVGERQMDGEGWDVNSVIHRPANEQGELKVGVDRRTTAQPARGAPRVAISSDRARESVAEALVVELPGVGSDVFEITTEVARDGDAWRKRELTVDGEATAGYDREYRGMWVAYCLTDALIVYVVASISLRPDIVDLKTLAPSEVRPRDD